MQCLGGEDEPTGWRERSCMFTNICYDPNAANFVFHRLPHEAPPVLLVSNGKKDEQGNATLPAAITEFPPAFVSLFADDKWGWSPDVRNEPIPRSAVPGIHPQGQPMPGLRSA